MVYPSFDSKVLETIMELNHLRKRGADHGTSLYLFQQLKDIFHIFESVGSTRIEGNRTTLAEYIEHRIESPSSLKDEIQEISNIEKAMEYIEDTIEEGGVVSGMFFRELHQLTVDSLEREGDKTPGRYRSWNVSILNSRHQPPEHFDVAQLMNELIEFVNEDSRPQFDLLKVAIAHHRFTWIHPFGNGNGRVSRLFTYALLIKYGFNVKEGRILNPTAVFCVDREKYYDMLTLADQQTDEGLLNWCEYVLDGILIEIQKIDRLLDQDFLVREILHPALEASLKLGYINKREFEVLKLGVAIEGQVFKASDVDGIPSMNQRQRTSLLKDLRDKKMIQPTTEGGRLYYVHFKNNFLMRSLVKILEDLNFIPKID